MFNEDVENPDGYLLAIPSTGQVVGTVPSVAAPPKKVREPNFVKCYAATMATLFGVGFTAMKLFMMLAKRMEYAENGQVVFLSPARRRNIQKELGIGKSAFDKSLRALRENGLAVRVENNVYALNPAIAGKGDWKNIHNIMTLINFKTGEISNGFEYDKPDDSELNW